VKTCTRRGESKAADLFHQDRTSKDGRYSRCKACLAKNRRANYDRYRIKQRLAERRWWLRTEYGLTIEDYDALLEKQGGACAVCQAPTGAQARRLHIDHDHETGKVRGLLCGPCNSALGLLREDPHILARMTSYILEHEDGRTE
jgi:hypothetical protein